MTPIRKASIRTTLAFSLPMLLAGVSVAYAAEAPGKVVQTANFVNPAKVNLLELLPPPPAKESVQTQAELAEIHEIEKTRTAERVKIAQEDQTETVFAVIRGDLGADFAEAKLPKTADFFKKLIAEEGLVVDPAKDVWARPRPAVADATVKVCVKPSTSGSYPSGHSTVAYMTALVLSDMLPERRAAIFEDAARFAESRIICGVHYRSDTVASRTAAAVIVMQARSNPAFQKEFNAAKAEVRTVLAADKTR
jgi:acid phosphatase (class A)